MPDRKPTIAEIRERMQTPSKVLWHNHAPADIAVLLEMVDSLGQQLGESEELAEAMQDDLAEKTARIAELEAKLAAAGGEGGPDV